MLKHTLSIKIEKALSTKKVKFLEKISVSINKKKQNYKLL